MDDIAWKIAPLVCLVGVLVLRWYTHPVRPISRKCRSFGNLQCSQLRSIPTLMGSSFPGLSLFTALQFARDPRRLLNEGYIKYQNSTFKLPLLDKWVVVVCGTKLIEEVGKRPDDELSAYDGIREFTQVAYTSGPEMLVDSGHESRTIIKENLTRGMPIFAPEIADELECVLQECIHSEDGGDWARLNPWDLMKQVLARTTSRVFVGLPLCRDERYLSIVHKHVKDFMETILTMNLIPTFLKPIIGPKVSKVHGNVQLGLSIFRPIIEKRKALMKESGGDWPDKPNDMLQWILDRAVPRGNSDEYVVERLLGSNFAAINSAANVLTNALCRLATSPETAVLLREEIESLVAEEGWTAGAISKMAKLDSFLKETQRYTGVALASMMKKAMKDALLSDGTFLPKGTILLTAYSPVHRDERYYPNSDVFDPFRFSRERERDGDSVKHQFTTSSATYLSWGYGPHSCPGRFFVVMEMKAIMAHILVHYDLKLGGDGSLPKETCMGFAVAAPRDGVLLFKKRRSSWLSHSTV
ncbi:cytochrome P450 [Ganoderma sinense ZZ0214-1]|uniref:Cytochrome P450 n=1 Tax=Ganoderma sinense ZZ0214-1 TaxID=1077348 RepID=A0A2G8RYN0_9APHY|nr:cytochrome P450 [Ganoderma sinense ZZ0214-1]